MVSWLSAARVVLSVASISIMGCRTAVPASGSTEAAPTRAAGPTRPADAATPTEPPPAPDPSAHAVSSSTGSVLRMHAIVNHGYGCGGHCAFNFSGESSVEITFGPSGEASVQDAGEFERSESYPDSHVDSTRTWRFAWRGTWSGDDHKRSVRLQPASTSCNTAERGSRTSGPTPCAKGPAELDLQCAWTPPPSEGRAARVGSPSELVELTVAWLCQTSNELPSELGTDLPWVFSPLGAVERRAVGEPFPETSYGLMAPVPAGAPSQ